MQSVHVKTCESCCTAILPQSCIVAVKNAFSMLTIEWDHDRKGRSGYDNAGAAGTVGALCLFRIFSQSQYIHAYDLDAHARLGGYPLPNCWYHLTMGASLFEYGISDWESA